MADRADAEHRAIVAVDVAGYNDPARKLIHQRTVHDGIYQLLEAAFRDCGIPWDECLVENTGDGALIVPPRGYPEVRIADELPARVLAGLRRYNATHKTPAAMQLRMALNAGLLQPTGNRFVSRAISEAFRVLDAKEAKEQLRRSGAMLAVIATGHFYDDVISHDPATEPDEYREIGVRVKETDARAWLRLFGTTAAEEPPPPEPLVPEPDWEMQVVELLLRVPELYSSLGRQLLLDTMRPEIAAAAPDHPQARFHLINLVRTCLKYDGGIDDLGKALATITPGTRYVRELGELIRRRPEA